MKQDEFYKNIQKIADIKNALDRPHYDLSRGSEVKIEVRINNKIENAKFIADQEVEGLWYANSQTYRAMKKEIFSLAEPDLQRLYTCTCKKLIDLQYWNFCPYCGESIRE